MDITDRQEMQQAYDSIVKSVIVKSIDELVRTSLGRILGISGTADLASDLKTLLITEAGRLIREDAEVQAVFRERFIKELKSRY